MAKSDTGTGLGEWEVGRGPWRRGTYGLEGVERQIVGTQGHDKETTPDVCAEFVRTGNKIILWCIVKTDKPVLSFTNHLDHRAGVDLGKVKWVNFHPPFFEPPSFFFFFSYPSNIEIIFDFSDIITKIHPPFRNPGSALAEGLISGFLCV